MSSSNWSNPPNQSNQQSSNSSNNQWSHKGTTNNNNNGNQKSSNTAKMPDLSSKLRKDGKLLPEEHQQCINQGLCLLCGSKGHMVKECSKSKTMNSSNTKACAAKMSSDTKDKDSMATESKKIISNLGTMWPKDCNNLACVLTLNIVTSTLS